MAQPRKKQRPPPPPKKCRLDPVPTSVERLPAWLPKCWSDARCGACGADLARADWQRLPYVQCPSCGRQCAVYDDPGFAPVGVRPLNDPLSYYLAKDGDWWLLKNWRDETLDESPEYERTEAAWRGAQISRLSKADFRNLMDWIGDGVCTLDELAVLVEFRGIAARDWAAATAIDPHVAPWLRALGMNRSPTNRDRDFFSRLRAACLQFDFTPRDFAQALREHFGETSEPADHAEFVQRVFAALHGTPLN